LRIALAATERHYMRLPEDEENAELQREMTLGRIISAASKLPSHALSALWSAALNLEREHS
jgi:hypothetical protein